MILTLVCLFITLLIIFIIIFIHNYFSSYQLEPFSPNHRIFPRYTPEQLQQFKTGDLVLFRWNDDPPKSYFSETLTNELRGAVPTHIGLLLRKENKLYVIEATIWDWANGKVKCIYEPHKTKGTKISDFEEMVKIYPGQIIVRKLNKPLSSEQIKKLDDLTKSYIGGDFDMSIGKVTGGVTAIGMYDLGFKKMGQKWRNMVKKPGIYCSEYIARLLQSLDILSKDRKDWSYAPYMFTKKSPHNSQFINGYSYGDEIQIT